MYPEYRVFLGLSGLMLGFPRLGHGRAGVRRAEERANGIQQLPEERTSAVGLVVGEASPDDARRTRE